MDTTIQLGSFVFSDLEVPQQINFGGMQQLVQHDLIGGVRVVDALGASDSDITWSGLMTGPSALARAQAINQLRASGQKLSLKWFNLNYNVVIQNFQANTERFYQVTYTITLRVISDGANPVSTQNLQGFNEAINNDLATATAITSQVNIPGVNATMNVLAGAIHAVSSFNGASPSAIATITVPLNNAIGAVQTALLAPQVNLFGGARS